MTSVAPIPPAPDNGATGNQSQAEATPTPLRPASSGSPMPSDLKPGTILRAVVTMVAADGQVAIESALGTALMTPPDGVALSKGSTIALRVALPDPPPGVAGQPPAAMPGQTGSPAAAARTYVVLLSIDGRPYVPAPTPVPSVPASPGTPQLSPPSASSPSPMPSMPLMPGQTPAVATAQARSESTEFGGFARGTAPAAILSATTATLANEIAETSPLASPTPATTTTSPPAASRAADSNTTSTPAATPSTTLASVPVSRTGAATGRALAPQQAMAQPIVPAPPAQLSGLMASPLGTAGGLTAVLLGLQNRAAEIAAREPRRAAGTTVAEPETEEAATTPRSVPPARGPAAQPPAEMANSQKSQAPGSGGLTRAPSLPGQSSPTALPTLAAPVAPAPTAVASTRAPTTELPGEAPPVPAAQNPIAAKTERVAPEAAPSEHTAPDHAALDVAAPRDVAPPTSPERASETAPQHLPVQTPVPQAGPATVKAPEIPSTALASAAMTSEIPASDLRSPTPPVTMANIPAPSERAASPTATPAGGLAGLLVGLLMTAEQSAAHPPSGPRGAGAMAPLLPLPEDLAMAEAIPHTTLPEAAAGALARTHPELASQLRALLTIPAGPDFPNRLLTTLIAVRGHGVQSVVADAVRLLMAEGHPDLAARLTAEASQIGKPPERSPDGAWRSLTLPWLAGASLQPMQLHLSTADPDGSAGKRSLETGRFVLELELKRSGPVQFDGRTRPRRLDLHVRTARPFTTPLRDQIETVFHRSIAQAGWTGAVATGRLLRFPLTARQVGTSV
ncbi:MAG TPA: hypothetical protein VNT30_20085 [Stellaceae bacterium]|nr:hypothetical protein [Stellaceae bacterium]